MVAPGDSIRQELFKATTPRGIEVRLVLLTDGRCGIVRAGEIVRTSDDGDERSIDDLIGDFLRLAEER